MCPTNTGSYVGCVVHSVSGVHGTTHFTVATNNTPEKCVSLFASRKVRVSGNTVYKMFDLFLREESTYREIVRLFLFAVHF
jgi:hypothetical protein